MSASTASAVGPATRVRVRRLALYALLLVALVALPFVLFGETFALPLLEAQAHRRWALTLISIALLTADSVAPVPSVLVIVGLAAEAGWLAGVIGGTVGLTGQVLGAAWFGRNAVGRLTPRFFSPVDIERMRGALQHRLTITLACLRSVPVLAETSVMVAASLGVPIRRIFVATFLPNLGISLIYSLALDDSWTAAGVAFAATVVPSYALWRWLGRRPQP